MKKAKLQKTNAIRLVDKMKISYQLHEYPWDEDHLGAEAVFETLSAPKEWIFKTIVTTGDKTGIVVACIPGDSEIDLKKLAKASGNKRIALLPLSELEKTTGYIRGGCSPIGMKKLYPTYFSKRAEQMERIIVSAGKRGLQIELDPLDLQKLLQLHLQKSKVHTTEKIRCS